MRSVWKAMAALGVLATGGDSAWGQGGEEWRLVWEDDFNGASIDTTRWNVRNAPGNTNNELQYYAPDEVWVADGMLHLRSQRRSFGGRQYTSGLVETRRKFAQTYGRFEVRAKLPRGQGIWPAHWMLPASGAWPPEIDIMELLGHDPFTVYMTNHWGVWPAHSWRTGEFTGPDFTADFHTFAVEWTPTRIEWYVDGVIRFASNSGVPTGAPFYLILNTAVGGIWPGNPDETTVFPQLHEIDWIRAYTKADPGAGMRRIVDYRAGGAVVDGVIEEGEYTGSVNGINAGFGDRLGAGSSLMVDSDEAGSVYLAVRSAGAWPGGGMDGVVVYLDTEPGGVTSTITNNAELDVWHALASGNALNSGAVADLYFADGFGADHAVVVRSSGVRVFRLGDGTVQQIGGAEVDAKADIGGGADARYFSADARQREVRLGAELLGVAPGRVVRIVGTLINGGSALRANEFVGVAPGNPWDGVASSVDDRQLKQGDFIEFGLQRCVGDWNESGGVTSQDFFDFLGDFFAGRADVDNSGGTTSQDFFTFLAGFFGGC